LNKEIGPHCAGWAKVGIVWAYAVAVWLVADAVKVGAQALFIRQEHVKEHCKMTDSTTPLWARAIDWPGNAVEATLNRLEVIACSVLYYTLGTHSRHRRSLGKDKHFRNKCCFLPWCKKLNCCAALCRESRASHACRAASVPLPR